MASLRLDRLFNGWIVSLHDDTSKLRFVDEDNDNDNSSRRYIHSVLLEDRGRRYRVSWVEEKQPA